jgi:hypothetical protein
MRSGREEGLGMSVIQENLAVRGAKGRRMLRVEVTEGDRNKVTVNVPLSLAKLALKFIPKDASVKLQEQQVSIEDLATLVDHPDLDDLLVQVNDENSTVRIYVE